MEQFIAVVPPVPGLRMLERCGQVHPDLNDLERAARLEKAVRGDLCMLDAAASRHPLDAAGTGDEGLACGIAVRNLSVKHKRQRFKPLVRMRPKRQPAIVGRIDLRPVVIQKQKRIQRGQTSCRQRPKRDQIRHRRLQRRMHLPNLFMRCKQRTRKWSSKHHPHVSEKQTLTASATPLRSTFESTGDIKKLSLAMGHSSLEVTLNYLKHMARTELTENDMPRL